MNRPFTLPVVIACSAHALLMFGFKSPEIIRESRPDNEGVSLRVYSHIPANVVVRSAKHRGIDPVTGGIKLRKKHIIIYRNKIGL